MERKASRGEWHGGKPPYGYAGQTSALEMVESEARVVRTIFDLCGQGKKGAKAIATCLNDQGLPTRTGGPWGAKSVLDILPNPIYVGEVIFRGTIHPGNQPAIIDRETFTLCNALLDERAESQRLRASHSSEYDLAGLRTCSRCRKRMLGAGAHGCRSRYRYYVCYSRQRHGTHGCTAKRLSAPRAEEATWAAVWRVFLKTEIVREALDKAAVARIAERPRLEEQRAGIEADIVNTEQVIRRYQAAFENGTLAAEDVAPRLRELNEQLHRQRATFEEVEARILNSSPPEVCDELLEQVRARIEEVRDHGTPEERKALLKELIVELRVEGTTIFPTYRLPRSIVLMPEPLVDPRGFEPLAS